MREVLVTALDRHRLKDCIFELIPWVEPGDIPYLAELDDELDSAEVILDVLETPADLVTMRSRVELRHVATNRRLVHTLAYPFEWVTTNGTSVLSPVGAALLGERVGNVIACGDSDEPDLLEVEKLLFQPESEGHYHL